MYARRSIFFALVAGGLTLGAGTPAAAEPNIAVTVDDGRASVRAGERHEYTVTVRNAGTETANLVLEVGVPVGVELTARSRGAEADGARVRWPLEVGAGRSTRIRVSGLASALPAGQQRLALTACALPVRNGAAVACATDMNTVAAGEPEQEPMTPGGWGVAGGAGVLLVAAGGGAWMWRRRGRGTA
ncbi:hypothetical protein AB0M43_17780 [Longispora sp. NPDC051575]|uniref:hypothetical protein n=1 Tax=Longispora sp. NPDC051575 TaxID=3154943 RepID=UPI0034401F1D